VGSVQRDPAFVARLRRRVVGLGLDGRISLEGPRTGAALDGCYAEADLLLLPSRAETYGMVVTEALARGVPVVASDVGGVPEALGCGDDGALPGQLVPPGDPGALGEALRSWLGDPGLRRRRRRAALQRRASLAGWSTTTAAVAGVLAGVAR
jgi:glycosyltransferase involved in cell wall biosynthesis